MTKKELDMVLAAIDAKIDHLKDWQNKTMWADMAMRLEDKIREYRSLREKIRRERDESTAS